MKTIIGLFEESVHRFSDRPYLMEKTGTTWHADTYSGVKKKAQMFGAGLVALGIGKGDRIALISEGRNAWVIAELGILYAGAVNVPLSVKLEEVQEIRFRLQHSGSRFVVVSKNKLPLIRKCVENLSNIEKLIILDNIPLQIEKEITFNHVVEAGEKYLETNKGEFDKIIDNIKPGDYANICYTSGTTADPKGIILTHHNYTANVEQACSLMTIGHDYRTLLILPWDHSFAHTAGIYAFMAFGACIASIQTGSTPAETIKNIPLNIKEVKPHVLMSVPALAKNFKKNIERGIAAKGEKIEKLFKKALKVAYSYNNDGFNKGKGFQLWNFIMYKIYDKLIFSKIRSNFGGSLKFFIGGGAILDIEIQRFFYAIGIPMLQGYGLSEASPIISANSLKRHKLGSSGFLVKNLELKICDENGNSLPLNQKGEIVVNGENVMAGYWDNENATSEALRGGWLHTGDVGYMDKDGFLFVLGRFKSLLIANDGEKYSPEGIEEALVENSSLISQCMLYNNQNSYTVALIVPDFAKTASVVETSGLTIDSEKGKQLAVRLIYADIEQFKTGGKFEGMFPQRWLPSSVGILSEPFTEQNQLLNSTLKMVRGKITARYQDLLDFLYTSEGKDICNKRNIETFSGKAVSV